VPAEDSVGPGFFVAGHFAAKLAKATKKKIKAKHIQQCLKQRALWAKYWELAKQKAAETKQAHGQSSDSFKLPGGCRRKPKSEILYRNKAQKNKKRFVLQQGRKSTT